MIVFYEYLGHVVAAGMAPAKLCVSYSKNFTDRRNMPLAERVFGVENNKVTVIKDRYSSSGGTEYITDEDLVVLKLKAVVI